MSEYKFRFLDGRLQVAERMYDVPEFGTGDYWSDWKFVPHESEGKECPDCLERKPLPHREHPDCKAHVHKWPSGGTTNPCFCDLEPKPQPKEAIFQCLVCGQTKKDYIEPQFDEKRIYKYLCSCCQDFPFEDKPKSDSKKLKDVLEQVAKDTYCIKVNVYGKEETFQDFRVIASKAIEVFNELIEKCLQLTLKGQRFVDKDELKKRLEDLK